MLRTLIVPSAIAAAVLWTYLPARWFAFLNWDDNAVILLNPELQFPNVWRWAFTTTYMEHYQPLSWLVWAAIKSGFGVEASLFHSVNITLHVLCAVLVWLVARTVFARTLTHVSDRARDAAALAAAVLFGIHPLRVEVVAWISALPYLLALAFVLLSVLAYVRASAPDSRCWWVAALTLYAVSLLARPVAIGYPIVLLLLDVAILRKPPRASVATVWPFALLAAAAAGVESVARATALYEGPWLFRLQSAVTAPFVYLWRTVAPLALTPLDPLPLNAAPDITALLAGALALGAISFAAWRWRVRWPAAAAGWAAYLALLAPAAGLLPSGLQLTADRYTYLPGVIVAMTIAGAATHWALRLAPARSGQARRRTPDPSTQSAPAGRALLAVAALLVVVVAAALATRSALEPWSDSMSLWTRVVTLNPRHDIGLYNLATALAADGRSEEAAMRYREVLALQPGHPSARANLDRIDAARLEREGNDLAARGDLANAAERYRQAIALDAQRTHSRASRGMALATLGRSEEAIPELREAVRQGSQDLAVLNALAVLLLQSGERREARSVLEKASAVHQGNVSVAHNLARLLATTPEIDQVDAERSLKLASAVVEATGGRDPRALDTMAAALVANGRLSDADAMCVRAAGLADTQGDRELAAEIRARCRSYRR